MNAKIIVTLIALAAAAAAAPLTPAVAQGDAAWKPTNATEVATGLDMPVDVAFTPDGQYAYFAELLEGNVKRIHLASGDTELVYAVPDFNTGVERGLFGLALDPDYLETGAVYISYSKNGTEANTTVNVLSRVVDGEESVLLERPGHIMHNGGRLLFVGDHLFLTTGDTVPITEWTYDKSMIAQDPSEMRGKVLRLTKDGAPAEGNPWGNAAYSMGHRNVYGIAWDPATGRLFVTENGSGCCDEINLIEAGANYGWPTCEGPCDPPRDDLTDPIVDYEETVGPTGATVFRGDLWFSEFNHGNIHRIRDAGNGDWVDEVAYHYSGSPPRILDLETHPDGTSVWFTTWEGLWRLDFAADAAHPAKELPPPRDYTAPPDDGDDDVDPDDSFNGSHEDDPPVDSKNPIPAAGVLLAAAAFVAVALAARRR